MRLPSFGTPWPDSGGCEDHYGFFLFLTLLTAVTKKPWESDLNVIFLSSYDV